jgi:hypothetical protein
VPALDTTADAASVQTEIHRHLGLQGRFRLAIEMSELVREFAKAGVRSRHPDLDERGVLAKLMHELYGVNAGSR